MVVIERQPFCCSSQIAAYLSNDRKTPPHLSGLDGIECPLMAVFSSRPRNPSTVNRLVRKHPSLFGIPFLLLMVGASYGLTIFTQTRYDLHDQKVKNVS